MYYLKRLLFCITDKDEQKRLEEQFAYANPEIAVEYLEEASIRQHACDDSTEGMLFVVDSGRLAKTLAAFLLPVLAYEHSTNKGEDFFGTPYVCLGAEALDTEYVERVYRRYHDIPWDIAVTDRLYLRETRVEDVDAFLQIYQDPEITAYTEPLFEREKEIEYTREYIRNMYGFYGFGIWTVIERATGKIIGRAGLNTRDGFELPEIGFVIGKRWQGQGYATEAITAVLAFAQRELEYKKIIAFVEPENAVSLHVLGNLGFMPRRIHEMNDREYFLMDKRILE